MSVFRRLRDDESGAVTIDWAMLTASVVLLALGAINGAFKDAMLDVVAKTADLLQHAMPVL